MFAFRQFEQGMVLSHLTLRRLQVTHDRGLSAGPGAAAADPVGVEPEGGCGGPGAS